MHGIGLMNTLLTLEEQGTESIWYVPDSGRSRIRHKERWAASCFTGRTGRVVGKGQMAMNRDLRWVSVTGALTIAGSAPRVWLDRGRRQMETGRARLVRSLSLRLCDCHGLPPTALGKVSQKRDQIAPRSDRIVQPAAARCQAADTGSH